MVQTLPLVLAIVMSELAIGSFALLYVLDWRSEVRRSFLIFFSVIYLLFTGLTYAFQQNFAGELILDSFLRLDKHWTGYQGPALLAFLLLLLLYLVLLFLDKRAGVDGKEARSKDQEGRARPSRLRVVRLICGGLTTLSGALTLFVMGMIYRPLAPTPLAGALTVVSFFVAALAIGGVMTSMWLGHWYLVTPALSERPLLFSTAVVLLAILLEVILTLIGALLAGGPAPTANSPTVVRTATVVSATATAAVRSSATPAPGEAVVKPASAPTASPLNMDVVGWLHALLGFAFPLILGALTWKLARERSFQSATGMLYLIVVMTLAGEVLARGMFLSSL
jgi:DMSO reductase anchor subunit